MIAYLPVCLPGRCRDSSFSLLKEGTAWHDGASRLLLLFEAVAGCNGSPGLALYNHTGGQLPCMSRGGMEDAVAGMHCRTGGAKKPGRCPTEHPLPPPFPLRRASTLPPQP